MILSVDQKDAITELVNIAFSRTAASLSDLTETASNWLFRRFPPIRSKTLSVH